MGACSEFIMLSAREREVMLLVSKGLSNKHVARRLEISDGTVKVHLHHIYSKLGIRNRTMLTVLALRNPDDLFIAPAPLASVMAGPR
jgi:two-component system nitrate/nitrite response regulator NarL